MAERTALVTGASGFVGRAVVRALCDAGNRVRAGVRRAGSADLLARPGVEAVSMDILDPASLWRAMAGVDEVYHFAAAVEPHAPREHLEQVHVVGTRNVWQAAASCGVERALYCSTAAVYGLLASSRRALAETALPRSIEPYGRTKLAGEGAALEVAARAGLHTTIIRPAAVFGPGEHSAFGSRLRGAAWSKLLLGGGFRGRRFSYVHVEDVAAAALHLMRGEHPSGQVFNVCVNEPISFDDAFDAYMRVLARGGQPLLRARLLAMCSALLERTPRISSWSTKLLGERYAFRVWHPGFEQTYSSSKLLGTSFRFRWSDFEDVFSSCVSQNAG